MNTVSVQHVTPEVADGGVELMALANLTENKVTPVKPWATSPIPKASMKSKEEYRAYIQRAGTRDCLYSGFVGAAPNLRIRQDNPPALLKAVVADFDTCLDDKTRLAMAAKLPIPPNFISTSYSGGTHAVWLLTSPLPLLPDKALVDALMNRIRIDLKLTTAFGGLDHNAFGNSSQYIQLGWDWQAVNPIPVSTERALVWLSKALGKTRSQRISPIPMERIAAEVEKRFPQRWTGEFTLGSRGLRFWDATADNPTAAIVTENGMLCFTGPCPFMSWETIFGASFVSEWEEESMGRVLKEVYYANNAFYFDSTITTTSGSRVHEWMCFNRQNAETLLASRYGLRPRAGRNEEMSEVKRAIGKVMEINKVSVAAPIIYSTETIVDVGGTSCLNTSFVQVMPPDMSKGNSWGDGFPWIAAFLEKLFPSNEALNVQLDRFMCEWAYTYRNAYAHHPRQGRVLFIAGATGTGKNFLTTRLYGPSLGGHMDASSYLLGQTKYNASFFSVGAWVCNDSFGSGDRKERHSFISLLKQMAANQNHTCEAKFKMPVNITWMGRVVFTLNNDPRSQEMLPDLGISNSDKISLYKTGDTPLNDPSADAHAAEELPALCAYLLKMKYPEHCIGDARWGVNGYLHEDLARAAKESSEEAGFWDMLSLFVEESLNSGSVEKMEGSPTWWVAQMSASEGLRDSMRSYCNPRIFGRNMASLAAGGYPVHFTREGARRVWTINADEFRRYTHHSDADTADEICPF